MLTISLDEFGDFEGVKNKKEPVYIAGLIYDDSGDENDVKQERKRIASYYQEAIQDASANAIGSGFLHAFTYPSALHSDNDRARNREVVGCVKEQVSKTLPEFLQNGTYKGNALSYVNNQGRKSTFNKRKGRYYLFAILKSDRGMRRLLSPNANVLSKDDYASNLYFHMADELISRLLFHNPILKTIDNVALDIATRSSGNLTKNDMLFEQYTALGYKKEESQTNPGIFYFTLTNGDVYRSVIADEIIRTGKIGIQIASFHVSSIRYTGNPKNKEFLFLSDSICSYLGYDLSGNSADDWLEQISQRADALTNRRDNFVFGYDEIDLFFQKAWKAYEDGDFYESLSLTFDGMQEEGVFPNYYKKIWFCRLTDRIAESNDEPALILAVQKLHTSVVSNKYDPDKGVFILQHIEPVAERIRDRIRIAETSKIIYQLYDAGMSVYTHIGDSVRAAAYFEKCSEMADAAGLEEYLATRNRWVVSCCDYFDMVSAKNISEENQTYQTFLSDMKKEVHISRIQREGTVSLGKAHSQQGQVLAFMRDASAEDCFHKALKCFKPDSANYKITQSYLLHFYLDNYDTGDYAEDFLRVSKEYFGGNASLQKQLKYIIDEGTKRDPLINLKYALYVFVRSLYICRSTEVTAALRDRLHSLEEDIARKNKSEGWKLTGHPSELIFIYMGLIEFAAGDNETAKRYMSRAENSLGNKGLTEEVICRYGAIELADLQQDLQERDQKAYVLCRFMKENYPAFADCDIPNEKSECYAWLKKRITYMYC